MGTPQQRPHMPLDNGHGYGEGDQAMWHSDWRPDREFGDKILVGNWLLLI